jgi:hypothetical protein
MHQSRRGVLLAALVHLLHAPYSPWLRDTPPRVTAYAATAMPGGKCCVHGCHSFSLQNCTRGASARILQCVAAVSGGWFGSWVQGSWVQEPPSSGALGGASHRLSLLCGGSELRPIAALCSRPRTRWHLLCRTLLLIVLTICCMRAHWQSLRCW